MLGLFSIGVRASIAIIMFAGCGYESLANNQDMLLSRVRQLTFEGRRSGEGYYSADGSKLIFQNRNVHRDFVSFEVYKILPEVHEQRPAGVQLVPRLGRQSRW